MLDYSIEDKFLEDLKNNLKENLSKILVGGNPLQRNTQKELIELMINEVIKLSFNIHMGYEKYSRSKKNRCYNI